MTERLLITKLVRTPENHADLYGRGHRFKDLTLFDLSDLAEAGVDYEALEVGQETPCRFWAIYELSDKLNSKGNPYKDVVALEPVDLPATSTSVDNSAILEELRAIRRLLERVTGQIVAGAPPNDGDGESRPPSDIMQRARAYVVTLEGQYKDLTLGDLADDPTAHGFLAYLADQWQPFSEEQKKLQAAARYIVQGVTK